MPVTIKTLTTFVEGSNIPTKSLFSNTLGKHVLGYNGYDCDFKGMQPSNRFDVYNALNIFIDQVNIEKFQNLLRGDFFYKKINEHKQWRSNACFDTHRDSYGNAKFLTANKFYRPWFQSEQSEEWECRPVVEDLAMNDFYLFSNLITKLIEKNDERFYKAFIESLKNTSLKTAPVFDWNFRMQRKIHNELESLRQYGNEQIGEKSKAALQIAEKLTKKIGSKLVEPTTSLRSQFVNLKFKLDLIKTLHEADETFRNHHGFKRFLVKCCTLLFSFPMLKRFEPVLTQSAFFKTRGEKLIAKVCSTVCLDTNHEIRFQNSLPFEISNKTKLGNDLVNIITQYAL